MSLTLEENDFDFYLRFAKPLILNLGEPNDRALAAAWIQRLRDEDVGDPQLRTDYLKLLLFVLQRNKLIGPFVQNPSTFEKLDQFPQTDLKDVAKQLLESEQETRHQKQREGGDYPPYETEHSADLLEYAAAQEIPNFGVHAYYAISNDPLPLWDRTELAVFPRGAFSATDQRVDETTSEPTVAQKKVQFRFEPKKAKTPTKYSPFQRTSSPIAGPSGEARVPLTWGSNLIGVTEPEPHEYEPIEESEVDIGGGFTDSGGGFPDTGGSHIICPGSGTQGIITREDFAPFDTMLQEYEREEPMPSTSGISIPSGPSGFPRGARIPHSKGKQRRAPSEKSSRLPPREGTSRQGEEVSLFRVQPPQRSAYTVAPSEGEAAVFDDSLLLGTPSPRKPKHQLFSPTFAKADEISQFFLEGPPSFLDDSTLPSMESLEDATPTPQKPKRRLFFPETSPNFLDDSTLPSIDELEVPSLSLRTPRPRRRIEEPLSPDYDVSLLFRTPSPRRTSEELPTLYEPSPSRLNRILFSPTSVQSDKSPSVDVSLPPRTPSPKPSTYSRTTQQQQLYSPQLPEEERELLLSESSQPYLDLKELEVSFLSTPPHQRHIEDFSFPSLPPSLQYHDVSLPLSTPRRSPRTPEKSILYSPTLPEGEVSDFFLETARFLEDSDFLTEDTLKEPSSPLQTRPRMSSSPRRKPHLLEALGLSTDQIETDVQTVSRSGRKELQDVKLPIASTGSGAAQDIIEDFNKQNQIKSQIDVSKPKMGIPRPMSRSGLSTSMPRRIPQPQRPEQAQAQVSESQLPGRIPTRTGRSQIARPKSRIPSSKNRETRLPSPMPKSTLPQPSKRSPSSKLPSPARPPLPRLPSPKRPIDSSGLMTSPQLQEQLELEPRTPSPRHPKMQPFTIGANESFFDLGLESPMGNYESPEPSSEESFGLPSPMKISDIPTVVHSPTAFTPEKPVPPVLERRPPLVPGHTTVAVPTTSQASPSDTLAERVAIKVELMLKELEEPFGNKWDLQEVSEQVSDILEESMLFPSSPEARSPVKEFFVPSKEELQTEIDKFLYETSPMAYASPKETTLFETTPKTPSAHIDIETPPKMGYQSPKTPPGYQSPTAFFSKTPPMAEFPYPESAPESPARAYLSPTVRIRPQQEVFSPDSPIESPRELRNRLRRAPYSGYGERDMASAPPRVTTIRELPDDYPEEDIQFLENVQKTRRRFTKRRRKITMPTTTLDNVFESPVKVPEMFEVSDVTGYRHYTEELEKRHADLPELYTPPRHTVPSHQVQLGVGFVTPPNLKLAKINKPPPVEIGSPFSPTKPDRFLNEEEEPSDLPQSPTSVSPEEVKVMQLCRQINELLDQNVVEIGTQIVDAEGHVTPIESMLTEEEIPTEVLYSPPSSPELKTPPRYLPPEQQTFSPMSPIHATPPPRSHAVSPYSPPESPIALHIRMFQAEEPPYYSRSQMRVLSGKTRGKEVVVKKGLKAPQHYTLREEIEGYDEENVPFRATVESHQTKFTKPRKKIRKVRTSMEDIRESPLKVPNITEVDDRARFRFENERLEKKFAHLPELEYQHPEELFGIEAPLPDDTRIETILDITPPRNLPAPMRPEAQLPEWKSPPQHKLTTPAKAIKPFNVSEYIQSQGNYLNEEIAPMKVFWSPPQISPEDKIKLQTSITRTQLSPVGQPTSPTQTTPKKPLFSEATLQNEILEDQMLDEISPKTPTRQQAPPIQQIPPRLRTSQRQLSSSSLGSPLFVDAPMEILSMLQYEDLEEEGMPVEMMGFDSPQKSPPRQVEPPLSPNSRREEFIDYIIHLYQQPEPPYYSKPSMDVLVGTGKRVRVKRHSRPKQMQRIREVQEDVSDEHVPFLFQVEAAGKLPPKRRRRIQQSSRMDTVSESPASVPNWFELEDMTGIRKLREELEARTTNLPELPKTYPEDLLGTSGAPDWEEELTVLDTGIPVTLPAPIEPTADIPGWKTPEHLRRRKPVKQPQYEIKLKSGLRNVLFHKTRPEDLEITAPPLLSPKSQKLETLKVTKEISFEQLQNKATMAGETIDFEETPEFYIDSPKSPPRLSPTMRRQKTSPLITFEQLQDKAKVSPEILDFEMLSEDYLQYESPSTPTTPRKINLSPIRRPSKKEISSADLYLVRELTKQAIQELMEEEEGVVEPSQIPPRQKSAKYQQMPPETQKQFMERIEEIIYDVPEPDIQIPSRPPPQFEGFTLPLWSPRLPRSHRHLEEINVEVAPEEILQFESPKTPRASPKKVTPKQPSPTTLKQRSPKPVARNLFEEFDETEDFLEMEEVPEERLFDSPEDPRTPPSPPRLEEYYKVVESPKKVETPKMVERQVLDSPHSLLEQLKRHRYTIHRYDTEKDLMTKSVHIKNKRVPIRKSKPPRVPIIQESKEEGTNTPPGTRVIEEEIIEIEEMPSMYPEFEPVAIEYASPPRLKSQSLPPVYDTSYSKHSDGLHDVSPPRWDRSPEPVVEIIEFPEFPQVEEIPSEFMSNYSLPGPTYFGSPGREYTRTPIRSRPYYDFDNRAPQSTQAEAHPQDYSLPQPVYFGSPGREFIRTPIRNRPYTVPIVTQSVTVTEYEGPYEDFRTQYNPEVFDAAPIEEIEEYGAVGY